MSRSALIIGPVVTAMFSIVSLRWGGEAQAKLVSFTVSNPVCTAVDLTANQCAINVRSLSVTDDGVTPPFLTWAQVVIDGRVRLRLTAFFESSISYSADMTPQGLGVPCGAPDESGLGDEIGKQYFVRLEPLDQTGTAMTTDTANVICPAAVTTTTTTSTTTTLPAVGVTAKKLIVIDKLTRASKAKVVYVAKDGDVTKGSATDPATISAAFTVAYGNGASRGSFTLAAGARDGGTAGWKVNKPKVARYVNKDDPEGGSPTGVKVAVIKPGKLLKLVGKTLGDVPIDVFTAGAPTPGGMGTAFCVTNGGETTCHCTAFAEAACAYKLIAGDTGAKLVCKGGDPDGTCAVLYP